MSTPEQDIQAIQVKLDKLYERLSEVQAGMLQTFLTKLEFASFQLELQSVKNELAQLQTRYNIDKQWANEEHARLIDRVVLTEKNLLAQLQIINAESRERDVTQFSAFQAWQIENKVWHSRMVLGLLGSGAISGVIAIIAAVVTHLLTPK